MCVSVSRQDGTIVVVLFGNGCLCSDHVCQGRGSTQRHISKGTGIRGDLPATYKGK